MDVNGIKSRINYEIEGFFVKLTQAKEEAYLIRPRNRPAIAYKYLVFWRT